MNKLIQFYALLLRLYPYAFQNAFADEMVATFAEALMSARRKGRLATWRFIMHELWHLPGNLIRERWRQWEAGMYWQRKPEWFFFPGWVLLTVLGTPLAHGISWIVISMAEAVIGGTVLVGGRLLITEQWLPTFVFPPAFGIGIGLLQYLLLRRYLPRIGGWIAVTALGMMLASLLYNVTTPILLTVIDYFSLLPALVLCLLIGSTTGLLQWLLLRRRLPQAGWWVAGTTLGWLFVSLFAMQPYQRFLTQLLYGLFPGLATGFTFWMLTRGALPLQSEQSP